MINKNLRQNFISFFKLKFVSLHKKKYTNATTKTPQISYTLIWGDI